MQIGSTAVIRPDLADAVAAYSGKLDSQFMATDLLPIFNAASQSGSFGVLPIANLTALSNTGARAPASGYNRQESSMTTDTFVCEEFGFEQGIDDGEAKRIGLYFDAEVAATEINIFRLRRAQEIRAAALLFNASNFSGFTAGVSTEWDTAATATPFADIQDAIVTLKRNVGGVIGGEICLACSEEVMRNIVHTSEIKAMRAGGAGSMINQYMPTNDELAKILGINKVFSSASQNNAVDIWDDEYALLFIRSTSSILGSEVQLGRTFVFSADAPSIATVETYRDESVRSNIIRCRQYVDEKVFAYSAGYLFSNITT